MNEIALKSLTALRALINQYPYRYCYINNFDSHFLLDFDTEVVLKTDLNEIDIANNIKDICFRKFENKEEIFKEEAKRFNLPKITVPNLIDFFTYDYESQNYVYLDDNEIIITDGRFALRKTVKLDGELYIPFKVFKYINKNIGPTREIYFKENFKTSPYHKGFSVSFIDKYGTLVKIHHLYNRNKKIKEYSNSLKNLNRVYPSFYKGEIILKKLEAKNAFVVFNEDLSVGLIPMEDLVPTGNEEKTDLKFISDKFKKVIINHKYYKIALDNFKGNCKIESSGKSITFINDSGSFMVMGMIL